MSNSEDNNLTPEELSKSVAERNLDYPQLNNDPIPQGGPVISDMHASQRENADPFSEKSGFPIWVMFLCAIVAILAVLLGSQIIKPAKQEVYTKNRLPYLPELTPAQLAEKQKKLGKNAYMNCASCHQPNGMGAGDYPPLAGSKYVTGDPQRLISIVHNGVKGPIEVKGKTYGNIAMVAYGNGIAITNDAEFAALLTYIRAEWGNQASPITAEQVKFTREALKDRKEQWTPQELDGFEPSPDFPSAQESTTEQATTDKKEA